MDHVRSPANIELASGSFFLQKVMSGERGEGSERPRVDLQSLNTRAYLDHTVVPILLDAMAAVAKER